MKSTRLLCALALAAACSEPASDPQPQAFDLSEPAPRTVILFVLDGVRADHLATYGYELDPMPNLSELASRSVVIEDHITPSTGTNAAFASIVTGLEPSEHGIGSIKEVGQYRLPERHDTLAERFKQADFQTIAVVSLPQLRSEFSGLLQGFDDVLQPPFFDADFRAADRSFLGIKALLARRAAGNEPLFVLVHLADARFSDAPVDSRVGPFMAHHLKPFTGTSRAIAEQVARLESSPLDALGELEKLLARGRGSDSHAAYQRALYDGRSAAMDHPLGQFLELLREAERYDDAWIGVVGTRGYLFDAARPTGGPAFPGGLVHTPFVLRFPSLNEERRVSGGAQVTGLFATWLSLLEGGAGGPLAEAIRSGRSQRLSYTIDAAHSRRAVFSRWFQGEENSIIDVAVFSRRDGGIVGRRADLVQVDQAEIEAVEAALRALPPARLVFESQADGGAPLEIDWRFARGFVRSAAIDGEPQSASGLKGRAELTPGKTLALRAGSRDLPVMLQVRREGGIDEFDVEVGARALSASLFPRVAVDEAEAWPLDDAGAPLPADLVLEHQSGSWWRMTSGANLAAGSAVEAVVALYPPGPLADRIEWSAGPELEVELMPGRLDAFRMRGTVPFSLQIKKTPRQKLAYAVALDGRSIPGRSIRVRDRFFRPTDELRFYVPDWFAGVTDVFDAALQGEPGALLRVTRSGDGMPHADRTPHDADQLGFAQRQRGDE